MSLKSRKTKRSARRVEHSKDGDQHERNLNGFQFVHVETLGAISVTLAELDQASSGILAAQAGIGARANRLESTAGQLDDLSTARTGLLSSLEDVDMAAATTSYAMADTVYRAALAVGARAVPPSLLDYLH